MKPSQPSFFFKIQRPVLAREANRFFSSLSTQSQVPAILKGKFNYNESFAAFVKATNQKKETSLVVDVFAKNLQKKQVFLVRPQPARIADIGCADSVTCLQYLKNIHYPSGFHYFGIDTNPKFLQEAEALLSKNPKIKQHTLIHGDAFSGRLKEREEFASASFEFIFVSHVAYYIKDELSGQAFLEDIIKLLSEQCGIAVFFHEDSTYYFRSTYNKNQFNNISTTPMLLEKSARSLPANFNQFKSISFTSKLHFSQLSENLWEAAKNPAHYENFAHNPEFVDTLEKLAFVVQCDLIKLAEEGCLSKYVDEIKEALTANNNCLDLETRMQTLVSPQCTLRHKIAKALKETEEEIISTLNTNQGQNLNLSYKM